MNAIEYSQSVSFKVSPELFLAVDNKTVKAKTIFDKAYFKDIMFGTDGMRIRPIPSTFESCRANHANDLARRMFTLKGKLNNGISVTLNSNIKGLRQADGTIYIKASNPDYFKDAKMGIDHPQIIKLLDTLVANLCVLLGSPKRSPENYNIDNTVPEPVIEYKTLSNFYMRSYKLMSLVTGMIRVAILIAGQSTLGNNYIQEFLDAVPEKDIKDAIKNADKDLAMSNWKKLEPLLLIATKDSSSYPLHNDNIAKFHSFLKNGLDKLPKDVLNHWSNLPEGHGTGWETFMENYVENVAK